jgi:transposase
MTIHHSYIGCDIAKAMIDVFDPVSRRLSRVANEAVALAGFAAGLASDSFVVFEATGHHDKALRHALARAGIACARLNPMMVRRFAQARGRLAKTDRIDARILSEMGAMFRPTADTPPCPGRERLAALARRRDQLVAARALELRHLGETTDVTVIADIEAAIADLANRIAALEVEIGRHIETLDELAAQAERLASAPGIGKVTALTLLAHMPELGTTSPKAIASLAGLAPFANDSGSRTARRRIRGGRPRLRRALYMAALGAIRANQRFKAFYQAIAQRSGSKKCAIIAVARKLITILNAMIRDQKHFA